MNQVNEINIKDIKINPYQPRLHFDEDAIHSLAVSIQENGLVQAITVRELQEGYELIAGERRLRAYESLGYTTIPALVVSKDDEASMYMALIENIQREDLSAVEQARAYENIMQAQGLTQSQFAKKIGKSQSSVANKIRLLQLDSTIQEAIEEKKISERHARALLGLDENIQHQILSQIVKDDLTVAETEYIVKGRSEKKKPKRTSVGFSKNVQIGINTIKQAVEMVDRTGLKTTITQKEEQDEVIIEIRLKK